MSLSHTFIALTRAELATCLYCNRANRHLYISRFFATASFLGNGLLWYVLMLVLLLSDGVSAVPVVVTMGASGILGTGIYKILKQATMRPRPCAVNSQLVRTVEPLDHFSFPSGHTLHAVCFTIIACAHYPGLTWFLLPFTAMVAGSRLVLGLHYPSDVLVGAALGATMATTGLSVLHTLSHGVGS